MNIELVAKETYPGFIDRLVNFFAGINLSIRAKILISSLTVIFLIVAVNTMMILNVFRFNRQYDAIMTNITTANSVNGFIKPAIDTEMWNIVAGKTEFSEGQQYEIIDQTNAQIASMMANATSDKSRFKVLVASISAMLG